MFHSSPLQKDTSWLVLHMHVNAYMWAWKKGFKYTNSSVLCRRLLTVSPSCLILSLFAIKGRPSSWPILWQLRFSSATQRLGLLCVYFPTPIKHRWLAQLINHTLAITLWQVSLEPLTAVTRRSNKSRQEEERKTIKYTNEAGWGKKQRIIQIHVPLLPPQNDCTASEHLSAFLRHTQSLPSLRQTYGMIPIATALFQFQRFQVLRQHISTRFAKQPQHPGLFVTALFFLKEFLSCLFLKNSIVCNLIELQKGTKDHRQATVVWHGRSAFGEIFSHYWKSNSNYVYHLQKQYYDL